MLDLLGERSVSDPSPQKGDEAYFEAAGNGYLVVRGCNQCGALHHYPRALCPYCFSSDLHWKKCSGHGNIYSFSITRSKPAPYCVAYIALAEGITILSNIVNCEASAVRIGLPVEVAFLRSLSGIAIPVFVLAKTGGDR